MNMLSGKERDEMRELSKKYLGSPNRAETMIKKGAVVRKRDVLNNPAFHVTKDGRETKIPLYEQVYYTNEDMLTRLRHIDETARKLETAKLLQQQAAGSVNSLVK